MNRTTATILLLFLLTALTGGLIVLAGSGGDPPTELYVRTVPAGAEVFIDGKKVGVSDDLFEVKPGTRKVKVELSGYEPAVKKAIVPESRIERVIFELEKKAASVDKSEVAMPEVPPTSGSTACQATLEKARDHYAALVKAYKSKDWKSVDHHANEMSDLIRDEIMVGFKLDRIRELLKKRKPGDDDRALTRVLKQAERIHQELESICKNQAEKDRLQTLLQSVEDYGDDLHDSIRDGKIDQAPARYAALAKAWEAVARESFAKAGEGKDNLLANPGAESGDKTPDAWEQGAAIPGVTYSWDKNVAHTGKAALCIEKTADRYFPIAGWFQEVDREGDAPTVELSAYVKAEKMTKAVLDVVFLDKNNKWISHQWAAYIGAKESGDPPVDHDWKEYSDRIKVPAETVKYRVGLQVYGPGKVWFDDVRLGEVHDAGISPVSKPIHAPKDVSIRIKRIPPNDVEVGKTVRFEIHLVNNTNSVLKHGRVAVDFHPAVVADRVSPGFQFGDDDGLTWVLPSLPPNKEKSLEIEAQARTDTDDAYCRVSVQVGDTLVGKAEEAFRIKPKGDKSENSALAAAMRASKDISVEIKWPSTDLVLGKEATFEISCTNNGQSTLRNARIVVDWHHSVGIEVGIEDRNCDKIMGQKAYYRLNPLLPGDTRCLRARVRPTAVTDSAYCRVSVYIKDMLGKVAEAHFQIKADDERKPAHLPVPISKEDRDAPAIQEASTAAPRPVKITPEIGATDVDPALKEIRATFDRDMNTDGMSWCGGGEHFPEIDGEAKWIDKRTCVLPVKLEKGKAYRLALNWGEHRDFQSDEGVSATPTAVYFCTKGAVPEVVAQMKAPKVVKLSIDKGARDVPPGKTKLSVTFDQPMGAGMSWCTGKDTPTMEPVDGSAWSKDKKTCSIMAVLEPGHDYVIYLNSEYHGNFTNEVGVSLEPVIWRFSTGK